MTLRRAVGKSHADTLIVVVDDDEAMGEITEMVLQLEGYHTERFETATQALAAIVIRHALAPDLLLTDFHMEDLDGLELIDRCKDALPNLRTILYSGVMKEETLEEHLHPPDCFVRKPFAPRELISAVERVLEEV